MSTGHVRLWQLLDRVGRESIQLQGVISRLFGNNPITPCWLEQVLATPEGGDRLESFVGKFTWMQDSMMDKLLPVFLWAAGERTGTAPDNLNLAQRLGFLDEPEHWLDMCRLHNRLVHEYVEDIAELAVALAAARPLAGQLMACHDRLLDYAQQQLPRPAGDLR